MNNPEYDKLSPQTKMAIQVYMRELRTGMSQVNEIDRSHPKFQLIIDWINTRSKTMLTVIANAGIRHISPIAQERLELFN